MTAGRTRIRCSPTGAIHTKTTHNLPSTMRRTAWTPVAAAFTRTGFCNDYNLDFSKDFAPQFSHITSTDNWFFGASGRSIR